MTQPTAGGAGAAGDFDASGLTPGSLGGQGRASQPPASAAPPNSKPAQAAAPVLPWLVQRLARTVAIIAALFTIYTEGATAYVSTEEAIKAKAAADNAALRQKGEAQQAEQQARSQLEAARNSAERQKGEADRLEAEAKKAEAEAQTAEQSARNAELKTRSEAISLTYEAEIRRSKAISELETARVAARKFKAEADQLEQNNKLLIPAVNGLIRDYGMTRCPGQTAIDKINAKDQGRC